MSRTDSKRRQKGGKSNFIYNEISFIMSVYKCFELS